MKKTCTNRETLSCVRREDGVIQFKECLTYEILIEDTDLNLPYEIQSLEKEQEFLANKIISKQEEYDYVCRIMSLTMSADQDCVMDASSFAERLHEDIIVQKDGDVCDKENI